jgi:trk system potassium uptake protein TrkA
VLAGDTTDEMLLEAENIDDMDLYLALTNDDENNIMSSLMAKRMGAGRVVALINRKAYVDLVQAGAIDIAISPAQVSDRFTARPRAPRRRGGGAQPAPRRGRGARDWSCMATARLQGGRRGASRRSACRDGAMIGAIVRDEINDEGRVIRREVIIPHHDTVIRENDHVIVFCTSKKLVQKVEKLFQVGFHFL